VKLDLLGVKRKLKGSNVGTLSVGLMATQEGAALAVGNIQRRVWDDLGPGATTSAIVGAGDAVAQVADLMNPIGSALYAVISKLEILVKIGDQIATVCSVRLS
jgi:hypothetical protein